MNIVMTKRPDEVLDYPFDFSRWLSTGDTISQATATIVNSASVAVSVDKTENDNTTATAWLSGGNDGETAEVKMQIVTSLGRTKDASFRLRIKSAF